MRVLNAVLSVAFMLFLSARAAVARGGENSVPVVKLEFSAVPEKQSYQVGEIVRLVFALNNSGDHSVLVARHFILHEYVWLAISGPEGKELGWCGKIDGRVESPDEFAILAPGATIRSVVRVSCDAHRDSGFVLDRPGTYTVSAYYHLTQPATYLRRMAGNAPVTTDRIRAKPVVIVLKSSLGVER